MHGVFLRFSSLNITHIIIGITDLQDDGDKSLVS